MYVPLWSKSAFSFQEGASHPEELVEACEDIGLDGMALTDRDSVAGIVEAHVKAQELGIELIIGAEMTIADGSTIVLLAMSRSGYANLCRLITRGRRRAFEAGPRDARAPSAVTWDDVCERAGDLIALWGGGRCLPALLLRAGAGAGAGAGDGESDSAGDSAGARRLAEVAGDLRDAFGDRLYAMVARHRAAREVSEEAHLRRHAARHRLPIVAANEVLYHRPSRRRLQDVLTCIRHGCALSAAGRRTRPNAEHALVPPQAFARLFADDAVAVARTLEVAERCRFSLAEIRYRYPAERLPDGSTSSAWLRRLTLEGAARRSGGAPSAAMLEQIERELALIDELDYCGYFLTMHEIVRFCGERGILCQGRGSAANSAVCYCLGITAVDPVEMGLLFERFLSRERAEPPDIDLDIEHARREEVIEHVYARYGRSHAAMVANIVRYRTRSALRDIGKALGFDAAALDRLSKLASPYDALTLDLLEAAGIDRDGAPAALLVELVGEAIDLPRHLSIHPGGFLLGHERVDELVPIENAAMPGRTVIQWDKDGLEALGLFKVDLLALGALTQLHLGFDLLRAHGVREVDMATVPRQDAATFDMICRGDTVGVFQIESRAQMAMLPRLRPRTYYDLVVEVSIVRPGPITGGMVHPYLRRRAGEEPIVYPHPCLEPVLRKTLGVPLFQEQVIRLAMVAADYTPGEADQLRRDMAAWRKTGRIERHRARLVGRMEAKGIEREFAERVFEQIRGFGEYGFPESHAASFALIAYAAAWMRCHYPDVFACSLLNALPMGFYSAATIIEDARRRGVEVRPVDVAASGWMCTLEPPSPPAARRGPRAPRFAVRLGMRFVKGLRQADGERVVAARAAGAFATLADVAVRSGLEGGALARLTEAGALASLEERRRDALWAVLGLARAWDERQGIRPERGAAEDGGRRAVAGAIAGADRLVDDLDLHALERRPALSDLDVLERIEWDYGAMGLSALAHPLAPLRQALDAQRLPEARIVNALPNGRRVRYAGLVICRQRPGTAGGVVFLTLEDETGFVNVVIWSRVFEEFALLVKTSHFLGVSGKLQVEDGVAHVIAESFWRPRLGADPEHAGSRDFH